ncbi:MAG: protein phosphatase 2C domain-containing protein, partial [Paenibacillaceae bacterium]|nr:protein phosphatase 2C domain-containing protein [Paenibacillaceae bacterium]
AAIEVMQDLHHKLVSVPGELARSFKQDLPRRVVRRWQHYVRDDAESRGIPVPEEMDKLRELYSRYGTTLLVALCTSRMILLGQIGDGNMMLINAKGHAEMLFANRSDELVGNATFSLCSDQSHLLWLTAQRSVEGKPTLLLMSTDGLSNSFDSDQSYQAFAVSLWESIRAKSVHAFRDYFPGMLRDFTERGSGDDITMALRFFAEPHIDSNRSAKEGD